MVVLISLRIHTYMHTTSTIAIFFLKYLLCATEQYQHQNPKQNSPNKEQGGLPQSVMFSCRTIWSRNAIWKKKANKMGSQTTIPHPTASWIIIETKNRTAYDPNAALKLTKPVFCETKMKISIKMPLLLLYIRVIMKLTLWSYVHSIANTTHTVARRI